MYRDEITKIRAKKANDTLTLFSLCLHTEQFDKQNIHTYIRDTLRVETKQFAFDAMYTI